MKKIVFGVVVVATTLISSDFNVQTNNLEYNNRGINVSKSNTKSLSKKTVKDGLGYKRLKKGKQPKFKIEKIYKKQCAKCHGIRGDRILGESCSDGVRNIERRKLEKILFYYAERRYGVDNMAPSLMKERLRNMPRVQIKALAKYISEELR
jgi:cytochrome c553